ncbi:hypothetical protein LEP1GSC017_3184 [Leptospira meyeri serovar Hardjo str. Went 5]|nr:hypothetical protein LEP1GSC017_3184 [Leptospira meyeri serovar Hardjo str. Went 5]EMJ86453.1 hypothetical protein LEP1GSC196_3733 [Leptospira meyeri serovar Semaranga str. Veldrot Semarang 173]
MREILARKNMVKKREYFHLILTRWKMRIGFYLVNKDANEDN